MKFNVSSEKLFQQLQAVSRVVANKSALKILESILFDLSGDTLTLTASDGETTIRTTIDVENAEGEAPRLEDMPEDVRKAQEEWERNNG